MRVTFRFFYGGHFPVYYNILIILFPKFCHRINRRWFNSVWWLERHRMSQRFQHLRFSSLWSWTQKSSRRYGFFTAEFGRKKGFVERPRGLCQISFVPISKTNLRRSCPGSIKTWSVQTQQSGKCLCQIFNNHQHWFGFVQIWYEKINGNFGISKGLVQVRSGMP